MTYSKDVHYWTQIRSALTAGDWSSAHPARKPSGRPISWSELLRKFNKHCRGFEDVSEIASQTQALSLLFCAQSGDDEDQDGVEDTPYGSLELLEECTLPPERRAEALVGYETLKKREGSNSDSLNFALAYYAYALGRPHECLSYISKIPNLPDIQSHIPAPPSTHTTQSSLAPSNATTASSLFWASTFLSDGSSAIAEIKDGRAWSMIEIIRSFCLEGMAHETLSHTNPEPALAAYRKAIPLLNLAASEIPTFSQSATAPASSGVGSIDFHSFTRFRELWRWVERLIWRAVVLTSKTCNINDDTQENSVWTWFAHYAACNVHWPPTFRCRHRSVVSVLHLQALILRAKTSPISPSTPQFTPLAAPSYIKKRPAWVQTARSVVQEYRAILTVSTRFPRAGERNVKVENLVDLCVAFWEASGEVGDSAGLIIDILWWATRLTFNSHRIFRHMTRMLYVSGDTELAKRTLRLYVEVVGKAYRVGCDSSVADTDRCWVETLVQGARMLCRFAMTAEGLDGLKDGREAGELIEKAKTRLSLEDKSLVASVDLAEGVWSTVMALKEQEPRTRQTRLAHAHAMFQHSVETSPTPAGHYHLALSFARAGPARDMDRAIGHLQSAIEGAPCEIRYWHTLGLLLAATEEWQAACGALEQGAEIGDVELAGRAGRGEGGMTPNSGVRQADGLRAQDFATGEGPSNGSIIGGESVEPEPVAVERVFLIDADRTIAPGSSLLQPLQDHPRPSRHEVLERALQLRMTQAAVVEHMDGPEGATDKWVEVFAWVADQRESTDEQKTPSVMPTALPDVETFHGHENTHGSQRGHGHVSMTHLPSPTAGGAPPIRVIPATPNAPNDYSQMGGATDTSYEMLYPITERGSESFVTEREEKVTANGNAANGITINGDTFKGKKVQQMLKRVHHKGQARISTISRKIGHGVVRGSLRRSNSAPDFHSVLRATHYQASSIHSRKRLTSFIYSNGSRSPRDSPPPPPPATPAPPQQMTKGNSRVARENRLLSDLWLMSAATFRRSGKIEQAKGSIQEAEVRDEDNPGVWVQLGLYYMALGHEHHAIDAFHKALIISPDDVSATVHLCRLYLSSAQKASAGPTRLAASSGMSTHGSDNAQGNEERVESTEAGDNVDLAAGLLSPLTKGVGWDVPEAWYFLAKAYDVQGRTEQARECLGYALTLSEGRGVREIGAAVGWFL